jgi:hypothetical protein
MPRLLAALIPQLILLAALPAQAEMYKWVDAKGQVNYSNAPPPSVAGVAQPVEERISVMGMDPAVRAAAERRYAANARAEELDWQRRQQLMSVQYTQPPVSSYGSSYLSPLLRWVLRRVLRRLPPRQQPSSRGAPRTVASPLSYGRKKRSTRAGNSFNRLVKRLSQ